MLAAAVAAVLGLAAAPRSPAADGSAASASASGGAALEGFTWG